MVDMVTEKRCDDLFVVGDSEKRKRRQVRIQLTIGSEESESRGTRNVVQRRRNAFNRIGVSIINVPSDAVRLYRRAPIVVVSLGVYYHFPQNGSRNLFTQRCILCLLLMNVRKYFAARVRSSIRRLFLDVTAFIHLF